MMKNLLLLCYIRTFIVFSKGRITSFLNLFINLLGLTFLMVVGIIKALISFWDCRIKFVNSIVISKINSKLMFELNIHQFAQMIIAPISLILTSSYYKYGVIGFIVLSILIVIFLLIITSQPFINYLFKIYQSVLDIEALINKYFSYVFTSSKVYKYSKKSLPSNTSNLRYCYRTMSTTSNNYPSTNLPESNSSLQDLSISEKKEDVVLDEAEKLEDIEKELSGMKITLSR